LTKNKFGYILGDFFHNAFGHPALLPSVWLGEFVGAAAAEANECTIQAQNCRTLSCASVDFQNSVFSKLRPKALITFWRF
jgi:phenylalanine-4-hydroxylase